jgi:hypothetical protein
MRNLSLVICLLGSLVGCGIPLKPSVVNEINSIEPQYQQEKIFSVWVIENGMSAEEIVKKLGEPTKIISDYPFDKTISSELASRYTTHVYSHTYKGSMPDGIPVVSWGKTDFGPTAIFKIVGIIILKDNRVIRCQTLEISLKQ